MMSRSRDRKVAIAYVESEGRGDAPNPANPWDVFSFGAYKVFAAARHFHPGNDTQLFACDEGDVDSMVAQLTAFEPDVLAASCFMWSFPLFVEVARRMRDRLPNLRVVFGGPCAHPAMFALEPYRGSERFVDALVSREGETCIAAILALDSIDAASLLEISGVMVPTEKGFRPGGHGGNPTEPLDGMPSPYQMELCPPGVPGKIELFRGCPMSCAFCEWGVADDPTRVHSIDWLVRELETYKAQGVQSVLLVDAGLNLNRRAFRNLVEAERQVGYFKDHLVAFELYPDYIREDDLTFLEQVQIHTVGVGLQTVNTNTHALMGRKFKEKKFRRGIEMLSQVAKPTIDLIFGLPGDSPESFFRTVDYALNLCDNAEVFAYHALVLPDGLMTRAPAGCELDFDPVTLKMRSCTGWTEKQLAETREKLHSLTSRAGDNWFDLDPIGAGSMRAAHGPEKRSEPTGRPPEVGGRTGRSIGSKESGTAFLDGPLAEALEDVVASASNGGWTLSHAVRRGDQILVSVTTETGPLQINVQLAAEDVKCYRKAGGLAWSYRSNGGSLAPQTLRSLDRTIEGSATVAPDLRQALGSEAL